MYFIINFSSIILSEEVDLQKKITVNRKNSFKEVDLQNKKTENN